jgi:hypothetical protein
MQVFHLLPSTPFCGHAQDHPCMSKEVYLYILALRRQVAKLRRSHRCLTLLHVAVGLNL